MAIIKKISELPIANELDGSEIIPLVQSGTTKKTNITALANHYTTPEIFGAIGNGIDNDTAALQAAIDSNIPVFLDNKTYLTDTLILKSNTIIFGNGINSCLLQNSVTDASYGTLHIDSLSQISTVNNITLKDFTVKGKSNTLGFAEHYHLISANGVKNLNISNCNLIGFRGDGVYIGSGVIGGQERHNYDVNIENCTFDGIDNSNRNGISVIDGTRIRISNNTFKNTSANNMPGPIDIEPDNNDFHVIKDITITDNKFYNCGGNLALIGLSLSLANFITPPKNIIISNNVASNNIAGSLNVFLVILGNQGNTERLGVTINGNSGETGRFCVLRNVSGLSITNNTIKSNKLFYLGYDPTDFINDCIITGNFIEGNGTDSGLVLRSTNSMTISNNNFYHFGGPGITAGTSGSAISNLSILGNTFHNVNRPNVVNDGATIDGKTCQYLNNLPKGSNHTFPAWINDDLGNGEILLNTVSSIPVFNSSMLPNDFPVGTCTALINGDTGVPHSGTLYQGVLNNIKPVSTTGYDKFTYQLYYPANNTIDSRKGSFYYRKCNPNDNIWDTWQEISESNYATPEMFGAKGDGVTNDAPAIQAAINSGAHKIVFAAKTYLVDKMLDNSKTGVYINRSELTLEGVNGLSGSTGTRLISGTTDCNYRILYIGIDANANHVAARNINIKNISFYGSDNGLGYTATPNEGIYINGLISSIKYGTNQVTATADVVGQNYYNYTTNILYISNTTGANTNWVETNDLIYNTGNITIENCQFANFYAGIAHFGTKNLTIRNCYFSDNWYHGFWPNEISRFTEPTFGKLILTNGSVSAVSTSAASSPFTTNNSYSSAGPYADKRFDKKTLSQIFSGYGGCYIVLDGNLWTVSNVTDSAIILPNGFTGTSGIYDFTFHCRPNQYAMNSGGYGIVSVLSSQVLIENNHFKAVSSGNKTDRHAMYLTSDPPGNNKITITNNFVDWSGQTGYHPTSLGEDYPPNDNMACLGGRNNRNVIITNNNIIGGQQGSIYFNLENGDCFNYLIANNNIENSCINGSGIVISNSNTPYSLTEFNITGNRIKSVNVPININCSNNGLVSDNITNSTHPTGIYLNSCQNVMVSTNKCIKSGSIGSNGVLINQSNTVNTNWDIASQISVKSNTCLNYTDPVNVTTYVSGSVGVYDVDKHYYFYTANGTHPIVYPLPHQTYIMYNISASSGKVQLPNANTILPGQTFTIKRWDYDTTNTITISAYGNQRIDDMFDYITLGDPGESITLIMTDYAYFKIFQRSKEQTLSGGLSTPNFMPSYIGQEYIYITSPASNSKVYKAVGTSSTTDWVLLN